MTYRIEDLVTFAVDADLQKAEAAAASDRWKAAAIAAAERVRVNVGTVDRFPSGQPGLGTLRLDNADKPPVPTIVHEPSFAEWLADNAPDHATATVAVPAAELKTLLDALKWAGVNDPDVRLTPKDTTGFFARCKTIENVDQPGVWDVIAVMDAETDTPKWMPVPGVTGIRPTPRWVLAPNRDRKAERTAAAVAMVEDQLDTLSTTSDLPPVAQIPTQAAPSAALDRHRAAPKTMRLPELQAACVTAGLPTAGKKADLVARIEGHAAKAQA